MAGSDELLFLNSFLLVRDVGTLILSIFSMNMFLIGDSTGTGHYDFQLIMTALLNTYDGGGVEIHCAAAGR